jgi:hypothetical protein
VKQIIKIKIEIFQTQAFGILLQLLLLLCFDNSCNTACQAHSFLPSFLHFTSVSLSSSLFCTWKIVASRICSYSEALMTISMDSKRHTHAVVARLKENDTEGEKQGESEESEERVTEEPDSQDRAKEKPKRGTREEERAWRARRERRK